MDEMITFDKDFEDRLEEYMVVFGDNKILPASEIKKQWSIYLEFVLDSCGWQALWKIPQLMCEKLDIPFPTVVIVYVDSINFENLTAEVQIIAVQGNIDLPLNQTANLTRLWPTKQQQDVSIDIISIADTLDMYRFFYYHLWMPWDLQESNNFDWIRNNLTDRLHLFFNVKEGNVPNNKARRFRTLLTEVKHIFECLGDDGTSCVNIDIPHNAEDLKTDTLVDLHLKIADLKTEIEILRTYQLENKLHVDKENDFWLVFKSGCTIDKFMQFLESVSNLIPSGAKYKSAVSLQDALDSANSNDSVIIGTGKHTICSAGVLDDGAVLKSQLQDRSQVIIDSVSENAFIDFSGKNLRLENLSINVTAASCGIMAQTGSISIKNCEIRGQECDTQHGIVALPGSSIELENCHISKFAIGFYISSSASLTLINCTISDMRMPVKIYTNAVIKIKNCKFLNYKKYGIYLISDSELEEGNNVGDVSLLQSKTNADIVNCTFESVGVDSAPVIVATKHDNVLKI